MKIVISTQYSENYGAHDWNGEGQCPQHWKYKGGSVYVVDDVDVTKATDKTYWKRIESLVEHSNIFSSECIVDTYLVDEKDFDISNYCEHWETPITLDVENSYDNF